MDGPKTAIKRGECYGCHVKELESARVTRRRKTDDIPDIRRGLSLSVVFLSAKRISVLFSPQLDYHRALLLVPFLWANIRQDCRRENIIIIELKQSSLQ